MRWARQWLDSGAGEPAVFLDRFGRRPGIEDRQLRQAAEAVTALREFQSEAAGRGSVEEIHPGTPEASGGRLPSPAGGRSARDTEAARSPRDAESPLARLTAELRVRHYSLRTEEAYRDWSRRYLEFITARRLGEPGLPAARTFLEYLALERDAAASTQNQALSALLFFHRHVLEHPLQDLGDVARVRPYPKESVRRTVREDTSQMTTLPSWVPAASRAPSALNARVVAPPSRILAFDFPSQSSSRMPPSPVQASSFPSGLPASTET